MAKRRNGTYVEEGFEILYFDDLSQVFARHRRRRRLSMVQDVPHTGPHDLITNLIADFEAYRERLEAATADGAGVAVDSVRIRPPLPKPGKIDCGGQLYGGRHPRETGAHQCLP